MRQMTRMVIGATCLLASPFADALEQQECLPFTAPTMELTLAPTLSPVRYQLEAALLRPQLEHLLQQHWGVQRVIWYADNHHQWPTDYELRAASWDLLLESLLKPYQLRVALHANHTAVVDYMPQALQP